MNSSDLTVNTHKKTVRSYRSSAEFSLLFSGEGQYEKKASDFYFLFEKMAINLQEFMDGYKTHEVVLGKKKRVFREPSVKMLLTIKDKDGADQLVKDILIEGDYTELENALKEMTIEKKEEFFQALLKELGLK